MTTRDVGGSLLRERDYRRFWAARVLAVAGAGLTAVALPLLAFDRSGGSALVTSAVAALQVAPYLVLGLLAGALADRLPRRVLMVGAELACVVALAALGLLGEHATTVHVLVVALVVPTAFVWFDAAAFGALPALVGRERLAEANGTLWTATTLAGLAAPAAGGLVVATAGTDTALLLDAAACLAAAALIARVGAPLGPTPTTAPRPGLGAAVAEGWAFVVGTPLVRALTFTGTLNAVAAGGVTGLVVVLSVERLGAPASSGTAGLLLTVAAGGALVASLALPRLSRVLGPGPTCLGGVAVGLPAVLVLAATTSLPVAVGALLVWSTGSTFVVLNGITARQRVTPDRLQARVNTTARMLAWGGTPFGALGAGAVASEAGVPAALGGVAAVLLAALAVGCALGLARPSAGAVPAAEPDMT